MPAGLFAQSQDSVLMDSAVIVPDYDLLEELAVPAANGGAVELHTTRPVGDLLKWHIRQNKQNRSFSGYRIQVYSIGSYGCDLDKLKEYRNEFEETYQDIPAYLKYFDPDFKIRVGNFHNRLESIPTLYRIRKKHPSSYPVKTEILLDELKRVPMQDIVKEEEETIN